MTRRRCTPILLLIAAGALSLAAGSSPGGERARFESQTRAPHPVDLTDEEFVDLTDEELLAAIHASLAEPSADGREASDAWRDSDEVDGGPASVAAILVPDAKRLSFQAMLTDTNGDPLAGATVNLAFRIYDGTTNALLEGPINLNSVAMIAGLVDVQIPINGSSFNGRALELGVSANGGSQFTPRIPLTSVPYAMRVNRVSSDELDNGIELGDATAPGGMQIYGNTGAVTIEMSGVGGWLETEGKYSVVDAVAGDVYGSLAMTGTGGEFKLWDGFGNLGLKIYGNPLSGGSVAEFYQADGALGLGIIGDAINGSIFTMYNNAGASTLNLDSDNNSGYGSLAVRDGSRTIVYLAASDNKVSVRGDDGNERAKLSGPSYGLLELFDATGPADKTVELSATNSGGGLLKLWGNTGSTLGIQLPGALSNLGGSASFFNGNGSMRLALFGGDNNGAAKMSVYDASGTLTVNILGSELGADGAEIQLREADGTQTIVLDAQHDTGGAYVALYDEDGTSTIVLDGHDADEAAGLIRVRDGGLTRVFLDARDGAAGGGIIKLYDAAGNRTITIDSDYSGDGRIITEVLQITGGADLAERFDVASKEGAVKPGMVVSIDPAHPGRLAVANTPYDTAVAGIISGAGGVKPGMMMGQAGSVADGAYPVALSGRVYCLVDAAHGSIAPGDLLTTSSTPGHAMKASDYERSRAAVIGKAMTGLTDGRGLVLVLVQPQ